MAYELSHIVQDGLRRMYGSTDEHPRGENVIYYLTVYNEPIVQPKEPENLDVEGLLKEITTWRHPRKSTATVLPRGCS